MLESKKVPCFICYKFVQINQTIKKYAYITISIFDFLECKMAFIAWFYQIIKLTKQIHIKNRFMIKIFQSVYLFFIEVFHFMWCYYLIVIQIDDLEPVAYAPESRFVFLTQHEPYEVFVVHFVFRLTFELPGNLIENAVDCFS